MKKAERKLESAQRSARNARENAGTVALAGAFAPIAAGFLADTVLPMVPGPTKVEFMEAVKARKGPVSSKRVLILGGITAGLVVFGGSGWETRAAAAFSGGLTGVGIATWKQAALALQEPEAAAAMVVDEPKTEGK